VGSNNSSLRQTGDVLAIIYFIQLFSSCKFKAKPIDSFFQADLFKEQQLKKGKMWMNFKLQANEKKKMKEKFNRCHVL